MRDNISLFFFSVLYGNLENYKNSIKITILYSFTLASYFTIRPFF